MNPPKAHVLLVDDDPSIRLVFSAALKMAGHEVDAASSGQEALDMAQQALPDLVLMDIMMPEMNGYQFLRKFRAAHGDSIPVLVVSAKAEAADEYWATRLKVRGYLTKPLEGNQLRSAVETTLAQSSRADDSPTTAVD